MFPLFEYLSMKEKWLQWEVNEEENGKSPKQAQREGGLSLFSLSSRNLIGVCLYFLPVSTICQMCRSDPYSLFTDRGSIYGSNDYRNKLIASSLVPSMSRKGDCYDNAVAESFFSTLKNELVVDQRFISRDHARSEIFKFIEIFYNRQRLHQTLNYVTPEMMELEVVA